MRSRINLILGVLAVMVLSPDVALACPVCFSGIGEIESPMATGMNNGILVLLAVIGVVQCGFVAFFLGLRRRARRLQAAHDELQLSHHVFDAPKYKPILQGVHDCVVLLSIRGHYVWVLAIEKCPSYVRGSVSCVFTFRSLVEPNGLGQFHLSKMDR